MVSKIARCILPGLLIFLSVGCAARVQPVCRHTAFMCALVMQEKYDDVEIAFGPAINSGHQPDPLSSHAQARVMVDGQWIWVNYAEGACQLTNIKERFADLNHYSVQMYYERSWKSSAPKMTAFLPTASFQGAISIKEALRY